jgi:hypothetical protein
LVVAIAMNSTPAVIHADSLYRPVLEMLEPQKVVDPNAPAPPPQHDL